jgi:hypothetical protein
VPAARALFISSEAEEQMYFSYNKELDILTINLHARPDRYWGTRSILPSVEADLTEDGVVQTIEVSSASLAYPAELLNSVADHKVWISLREAAESVGLSPDTLRVQVNNGRLRAEKKGPVWLTTLQWFEEYLASRRYNGKNIDEMGS